MGVVNKGNWVCKPSEYVNLKMVSGYVKCYTFSRRMYTWVYVLVLTNKNNVKHPRFTSKGNRFTPQIFKLYG